MKSDLLFVSLLLTSSLAAAPVAAKPGGKGGDRPCAADAERLSAGVAREGGARRACLQAHQDEVAPACKAKLEAHGRLKGACKADRAQHCAGVKGKAAVAACLASHTANLEPPCAEKLERRASRRAAGAAPAPR